MSAEKMARREKMDPNSTKKEQSEMTKLVHLQDQVIRMEPAVQALLVDNLQLQVVVLL